MYKYSKGINLVAGGEKHRVYVKKSPTGVGKGVKGHVMVNHPTEDKGKWDTIDLTEKAGTKTVEEGKNATKKWHAENPYVSGTKSVKQYRGDENLPEAKNGMKKNCGCKHSKSKYKYQKGVKKTTVNQPEEIELYFNQKDIPTNIGASSKKVNNADDVMENLDYYIDYDIPKAARDRMKISSKSIPTRNTIKKDTASVQKKTYPTVSGEKKIYIEKTPVTKTRVSPASTDRATEYFNNYTGGDMIPGKKYQLVDGKMIVTDNQRWSKKKLAYDWEDLSEGEKNKVLNLEKQKKRNALQKEVDVMNDSMKYRTKLKTEENAGVFVKGQKAKEIKEIQGNVKRITSAVEGKSPYKYGTGALVIPEGSAVVTAQKDENGKIPAKEAVKFYKYAKKTGSKKAWEDLDKVINKMPEDNVDKAQNGEKKVKKIAGKKSDDFQEEFVIGDKRYGRELSNKDVKELYALSDTDLEKSTKFSPFTKAQEKAKRAAARNKQESFTFTYKGKTYSGVDGKGYSSGYKIPQEGTKTSENKTEENKTIPETTGTPTPISPPTQTFAEDKKKGNFLANIPSLAEIVARASILGKGIEYSHIPENYLALDRYRYESQLPKTLREIQLAQQAGRENARDVLGGDAARYMSQSADLSAAGMKAANEAVIQDTLARQDILNKNVDLSNVETQTNRSLKDQYAAMRNEDRMKARAAYDEQLISLGQRIDSATETAQQMSNQRNVDDIRTNLLKSKDYYMDPQGNIRMIKNGLKKVKAYKRR